MKERRENVLELKRKPTKANLNAGERIKKTNYKNFPLCA